MKKNLIFFFMIFLLVLLIAHPPSEIKITYDINKSEIYIDILHKVKSRLNHFVYEMELYVNGKKVVRQDATTQVNDEKQQIVYLIPGLKQGDKVYFWAECNKVGDRKKEIIITKDEGKGK